MKISRWALTAMVGAVAIAANRATAVDMKAVIPDNQITVNMLKTCFEQSALQAEIDSDGDLKITEGEFKSFIRVDEERKILTIFALYGLKASAPEIQKLRLINRLNDKIIVVRFSMPNPTTLWCDLQFSIEGGLTPFYIINTYRLFARVVSQAVAQQDVDDVVGSD